MKRHLLLVAAALFVLAAVPVSAQLYWAVPGSTGAVDEASAGLYEVNTMRAYQCGGYVEEVTSWGPGTDTSANTCNEINISTHTWDLYGYVYYFEVTLTRTSTSTNPQFHAAQLHP